MRLSECLLLVAAAFSWLLPVHVNAQESNDSLNLSRPIISDLHGERVQKIIYFQPVTISVTVNNNLYDADKPMIGLIEVRGQSGVTLFIAYQSLSISHGEDYTFGVSWMPDSWQEEYPGDYSARTFVVTCFCNTAEPLSQVLQSDVEVDYPAS